MKLLLITFSDNADHQEVLYSLFEELKKTDIDVSAIGIKNPKVPCIDGVEYVDAPLRPGICKGTFNCSELLRVIRLINQGQFDMIYFETLHTWNIPIWLLHGSKTKIVQAVHDVEPHEGDSSVKTVELINRVAVKCVDKVLLRNQKFIPVLKEKYCVEEKKIVSLDPWRRFPEFQGVSHSHRVLFFGRINEYKGIEYLPEIVRNCKEIQFDIVGKVDSAVANIVEELKKFDNVNLCTEYVSDEQMIEYFNQCDFVILPYKSASQSGVVLDANKFGRPVIAFSVGAISNQIVDNQNGILVDAGDVASFVNAIKRMMTLSDCDLDAFSRRAYDYAYERFSSVKASRRFIDEITEVIK